MRLSRLLPALALVCACGSHSGGAGAGGADSGSGSIDAAPPDAPPVRGAVTVRVVDHTGAPLAGKHVVFIDTDQSTTSVVTDASGAAMASVFPGASVTAVHVTSTGITALTTVLAVVPGDTVTLDADAFVGRETPLDTISAGKFTVTYPSYAGASGYTVYDPCGMTAATGTTAQLMLQAGCVASTMDLVVTANGTSGVLAWIEKPAVAFNAGGSTAITGSWRALVQVNASYTNTTGIGNIELDRYTPTMRGAHAGAAMDVTGATTTLALQTPLAATAAMHSLLHACSPSDATCSNPAYQIVTQVIDGTATSYALDVGAQLLPWLGYPVFAPATSSLKIPVTGSGTMDLFAADLTYVRNNTNIYVWRVFGPAPADVHFPTLPASATDATIQPTDKMSTTHAYGCDSDAIAGYRTAVADVYAAFGTCAASPDPATHPFGGTLNRFSQSN